MSAADHETAALMERITVVVQGAPTISAKTFAALALPLLMEADNALDALVGLLRQTEQERDEALARVRQLEETYER